MTISSARASLLTYLLALTGCAGIPLLCFAAYLTMGLGRTEQAAVERGVVDTVNALVTGVDREFTSTIATLEALATAPSLDEPDLDAFRTRALRVLESQKARGWLTVHLTTPDATPLMNARYAPGATLPRPDPASVGETVATRRPLITDLVVLPEGGYAYGVGVPVIRGGAVKYVLTAAVSAEAHRELLLSQARAPDRIAVLYDRQSRIVYRTVNPEKLIGTTVTPKLAEASARQPSGALDDANREGIPVRVVFQRSSLSGWAVAVGIPQSTLYAAQQRSLRQVAGVGTIFLAASVVVALTFARRIRRNVAALVTQAETLSDPDAPVNATDPSITELARLRDALRSAAQVIHERGASLQRQLAALDVARTEAEAANRAKDEFLAVLSHELRTPLNAVFGWAQMLRKGQVHGEVAQRALDTIVRNAHVQLQLIDELLDVSRVAMGKMRLQIQPLDPRTVIEQALDAIRPAAEARRITVHADLARGAGVVIGDAARLQQVVWNLLTNAVKFTEPGGEVEVVLRRSGTDVEIIVHDTGRGITPELLPFVFDRFRQADSSSTRAHSGLGLGLALVKHLVELHGGTVAAHSDGEGKGATFTIRLPVTSAALDEGGQAVPSRRPAATILDAPARATRLDGLRVLVVDDDVDALELATAVLVNGGAVVRTCGSATEALQLVQAWRPDVLVSDIEMPGEDGYTLIGKVRALDGERGGRTPAVALTAYGRPQDRVQSLAAGYDMHVPKPIDPGELTTIIAGVAGRAVQ